MTYYADIDDFDPDGMRVVQEPVESRYQREPECQTDGDCEKAGCGNWCMSRFAPQVVGTCEAYPELEGSYCGCVVGDCRWFKQ